jgi:hypothetical protein
MITGDECGLPKKGEESVGVARQYCGNLGKVDNCQVGVMMGYVSARGYSIVDSELYMPKQWFEDCHAEKRKKCGVPSGTKFRTKNEILMNMITNAVKSGKFSAKYVGVDSAYGGDTNFLDSLPDGLIYFADVPVDTKVFGVRPETFTAEYSGRGRKPVKLMTTFSPLTVKVPAEDENTPWNTVVLGIGAKGPIITEDKIIPIVESRGDLPGKDVWLYVRKLEDGKIKYSLCNAPIDSTAEDIRKPALMRWSIEQCFKECKKYLGMDHYETRSWTAWHRHMLLSSIAHLFILKLKTAFSSTPTTPSPTPHIDGPVSFSEYSAAYEQMLNNEPIVSPNIMEMPSNPQKFMTIGIIRKLICETFVKTRETLHTIDYLLYKAWSAFSSHSISKMKKAMNVYSSG